MTALLHRRVPRVQGEIKGPWNYWSPFCIYLALTWTLTCQLMTSLTFIESTSKTGNNQLQLLWNSSPRWLATGFSSLGSSYDLLLQFETIPSTGWSKINRTVTVFLI